MRPKRQDGHHTESESEFSEAEEEMREYDDWQILAAMGPDIDLDGWAGPAFGNVDVEQDWHAHSREWGPDGLMERAQFIELNKRQVRGHLSKTPDNG